MKSNIKVKVVYVTILFTILCLINSCRPVEQISANQPNPSGNDLPANTISIDIRNKNAVINAYKQEFLKLSPNLEWVGNIENCQEGYASKVLLAAQLNRINYFRSMAGIDNKVTFIDSLTSKSQKAALMMASANTLSHTPSTIWKCYSPEGAQAAGHSNLAMSSGDSPDFITQYMQDAGANNKSVGHRRWLLSLRNRTMGSGNVFQQRANSCYNALWVFGDSYFNSPRSKTREEYVAWPVAGYIPNQIIYPRWSFQLSDADFSLAQVSVKYNGVIINPSIVSRSDNYGENTLVWEMESIQNITTDLVYEVMIQNVKVASQIRSFTYKVIAINPI